VTDIILTEPTAIVGEKKAGESAKVRKNLELLISNTNSSAFDIGELAHKIKKQGYYTGYTTFQEYAKSLPIKLRKLQYLRRIAEVMDILNIPRERYEPIGIAKLREITSLEVNGSWTNPETKQEVKLKDFILGFVDKAKSMSLDTIKQHVKTLKGLVGDDDIEIMHIGVKRLALTKVIRPALELMKAKIGSVKKDDEGISQDATDGAAFELICADWSSSSENIELIKNISGEEEDE